MPKIARLASCQTVNKTKWNWRKIFRRSSSSRTSSRILDNPQGQDPCHSHCLGIMVAAFPLAKLGLLVVKQISKPLANAIARRAKSSKFFRNWVCIPTAQIFHWADVKVRMRILNLGKVSKVPKLDETKAIETGAQVNDLKVCSSTRSLTLDLFSALVRVCHSCCRRGSLDLRIQTAIGEGGFETGRNQSRKTWT